MKQPNEPRGLFLNFYLNVEHLLHVQHIRQNENERAREKESEFFHCYCPKILYTDNKKLRKHLRDKKSVLLLLFHFASAKKGKQFFFVCKKNEGRKKDKTKHFS